MDVNFDLQKTFDRLKKRFGPSPSPDLRGKDLVKILSFAYQILFSYYTINQNLKYVRLPKGG